VNPDMSTQATAPPRESSGHQANPVRKTKRVESNAAGAIVAHLGGKPIRLRPVALTDGPLLTGEVKTVGHGRLLLGAAAAEQAIFQLDQAIQRLLDEKPCNMRRIIALMRVKLDFNRQVLAVGTAQLRAATDSDTA